MASAGSQDISNRFDTGSMARHTGQALTLGPAIITIHDDRYMPWNNGFFTIWEYGSSWGHSLTNLYFHQIRFFRSQLLINLSHKSIG